MRPHTQSYTRRTITRAQAAEAAARNVQCIGDIDAVAKFATNLISRLGSVGQTLPRLLRSEIALADLLNRQPVPNTAICIPEQNLGAIRAFLLARASPSGNDEALIWIVSDLLGDRLDAHAEALKNITIKCPKLYEALFKNSLLRALQIGKRAGIPRERLARLVGDHARFALVSTAHDQIARIRQIATSPYGHNFSGFNKWKFAGHVLLATVAEPAMAVEEAYSLAFKFNGSDEAVRKKLVDKKVLAVGPSGSFVFEAALATRATLESRNVSPGWVKDTLVSTSGPLKNVARISERDITEAGLARTSMSSVWFDLEPSELATYVAIELLKALAAVDEIVSAALDNKNAVKNVKMPSDRMAAFTATLLRAEGQSDRESMQIGRARGCDGGISPYNKGSRQPLLSLKTKLSTPDVAAAARTFGIDAGQLFRR